MIKQIIFLSLLTLSCKTQKVSIATYIPYDEYYVEVKSPMGVDDFETLIKYPVRLHQQGEDYYWFSKSEISILNIDTIKWIRNTIHKNIIKKYPLNWAKSNKSLWDFNPQNVIVRYPGYLNYDPEGFIQMLREGQGYNDTLPDFSRTLNLKHRIIYVKRKSRNNDTIYLSTNSEIGIIKHNQIRLISNSLIVYNRRICVIHDMFWSSPFYHYLSDLRFKPQENKYWYK